MLAQLRGDAPNFDAGVECNGDVCRPVDQFGNPLEDAVETGSGYWWPRVSLTFVAIAALLTLAATRLVVPAGMRWAFKRPGRRGGTSNAQADDPIEGAPVIQELQEEPDR
jgi:hypothetical protein